MAKDVPVSARKWYQFSSEPLTDRRYIASLVLFPVALVIAVTGFYIGLIWTAAGASLTAFAMGMTAFNERQRRVRERVKHRQRPIAP